MRTVMELIMFFSQKTNCTMDWKHTFLSSQLKILRAWIIVEQQIRSRRTDVNTSTSQSWKHKKVLSGPECGEMEMIISLSSSIISLSADQSTIMPLENTSEHDILWHHRRGVFLCIKEHHLHTTNDWNIMSWPKRNMYIINSPSINKTLSWHMRCLREKIMNYLTHLCNARHHDY